MSYKIHYIYPANLINITILTDNILDKSDTLPVNMLNVRAETDIRVNHYIQLYRTGFPCLGLDRVIYQ